jgi:hypothetical protein
MVIQLPTLGIGEQPYEESDSRLDVSFQEASKQAMRKAA